MVSKNKWKLMKKTKATSCTLHFRENGFLSEDNSKGYVLNYERMYQSVMYGSTIIMSLQYSLSDNFVCLSQHTGMSD